MLGRRRSVLPGVVVAAPVGAVQAERDGGPARSVVSHMGPCSAPVLTSAFVPLHDIDRLEGVLSQDLGALNRRRCGSARYAFHAVFTGLFPDGPPEEG